MSSIAPIACPNCCEGPTAVLFCEAQDMTLRGVAVQAEVIGRECTLCNERFQHTQDLDWRKNAYAFAQDSLGLSPRDFWNWVMDQNTSTDAIDARMGWHAGTTDGILRGRLMLQRHIEQVLEEKARTRLPG